MRTGALIGAVMAAAVVASLVSQHPSIHRAVQPRPTSVELPADEPPVRSRPETWSMADNELKAKVAAADAAEKAKEQSAKLKAKATLETSSIEGVTSVEKSKFEVMLASEEHIMASHESSVRPAQFDTANWTERTGGGLNDLDRRKLAQVYGNASSVFEWGLGESTNIASYLKVPRYSGVDSDPNYVHDAKGNAPSHFRFSYADIGQIKEWGYPVNPELSKNILDYQLAPLATEPEAFDVYMVDGRWRMACVMVAFLHASARGSPDRVRVLIHDWQPERPLYHKMLDVLVVVDHNGPGGKLAVLARKESVTDQHLYEQWLRFKDLLGR